MYGSEKVNIGVGCGFSVSRYCRNSSTCIRYNKSVEILKIPGMWAALKSMLCLITTTTNFPTILYFWVLWKFGHDVCLLLSTAMISSAAQYSVQNLTNQKVIEIRVFMRVYFLQLLFCTRFSLICQVCHMVAVISILSISYHFSTSVYSASLYSNATSQRYESMGCTEEKQKKQGVVGRLLCEVRKSARHSLVLRDTFDPR